MEPNDYPAKQIDALGAVLAKILVGLLGLKAEAKLSQTTVDAILKEELGVDVSQITSIPETDFIDWLQSKHHLTAAHLETFGEILLAVPELRTTNRCIKNVC